MSSGTLPHVEHDVRVAGDLRDGGVMDVCSSCGERVAGQGRIMRKKLVCVWCCGSPAMDAMRARSKAQAAQLQAIASTPQKGLTSELAVLRAAEPVVLHASQLD